MAKRRRKQVRPDTAKVVLVFLLLAVCVYIALTTTVGTFIAQKIIAPIFALSATATPAPSATPAPTPNELDLPTGGGLALNVEKGQPAVSEEVRVEAVDVFAVQMGAFSSKQNADNYSQELKARGAGGYVYYAGDHYRVLAACYDDMDDAKKVRDQLLKDNGLESSVYTISVQGAALKVTADEQSLAAVKSAFGALEEIARGLSALTRSFDEGTVSQDKARQTLLELAELAQGPVALLSGEEGVSKELCAVLGATASELKQLSEATGTVGVEFSSRLKYAQLLHVCAYAQLLGKLQA